MFNTILSQLLTWSLRIKNQTQDFGNTETLVGGLLEQIVILVGRISEQMANVAVGVLLKGSKANESEIKSVASPKRGDTWKAVDTGRYWVFDGTSWNDIGIVIPSDVALHGGSTLTMQQMDDKKADRTLATATANGLMSKEQVLLLNQLIEQMGTALISDRYDSSVFVRYNNTEPISMGVGIILTTTSDELHVDSNGFLEEWQQQPVGGIYVPVNLTSANGYVKAYYNSDRILDLTVVPDLIESVQVVSTKIEVLKFWESKNVQIDIVGCPNLTKIQTPNNTRLKYLNAATNSKVTYLSAINCYALTGATIHGQHVTEIYLTGCSLLSSLTVFFTMEDLQYLFIERTAINRTELLNIESKWLSRIGKTAGVLGISEALFNSLTTEDKALFINKNITFYIE